MKTVLFPAEKRHLSEIQYLYELVALKKDGIIRNEKEITKEYVENFLENSMNNGLILLAGDKTGLIGEIHAYTPGIYAFRHILSNLTIVVHPEYQGMGVGRRLFKYFLDTVKEHYTHILRIELFVRSHNHKVHSFYQSLGFTDEGHHEKKILNRDMTLETPIHMAWFNPRFNPQSSNRRYPS